MVGTMLSIIVESNMPGQWDGGLFIKDPYRDNGILLGRDYNDVTGNYDGSCLPAAGIGACVTDWEDDIQSGFDLYGHRTAVAGDWFIIDYVATDVGSCEVAFYDYELPDGTFVPKDILLFSHVPTRDFNNDTVVSFNDFAIIVAYWHATTCGDPDWCEGADLNRDRDVDYADVKLFADFWLEKTEHPCVTYCTEPLASND